MQLTPTGIFSENTCFESERFILNSVHGNVTGRGFQQQMTT